MHRTSPIHPFLPQTGDAHHPLLSPFLALGRKGKLPIRVPAADRLRWSERFHLMARELEERPPGYRYGLQAHLSLVLLDVLRLADQPGTLGSILTADPLLAAAFEFIEQGYARPISAQDVARAVQRSTAHLTTTMRLRTGLTAGEWIAERRTAEARRLLAGTGHDLAAIADLAGYSDTDAFCRSHRLTPAAWRQAHRGQPPYVERADGCVESMTVSAARRHGQAARHGTGGIALWPCPSIR